ncbi:hypothetical protein Lal_00006441 [Lupinus albus]|uniref:Uncharacterized protein n=1 Tax=Lupinus albus TaxID=3870 RepID=A0A6A4Q900_LUPAL|nr:hypothetical protein Lalb_Chr07g0181961 [Lupinus albus]KAF1875811.1 hypothetical protein Lal_00006441 [Lupinus albus]
MDHTSVRGEGVEVDIESGLIVNDDDSKNVSTLGTVKQGNTLVTKIYCGLVGKGGNKLNVYCNESNSNGVSTDVEKVTSKLVGGQDSVDCADKTSVKEKRKRSSHKKAPKPPRPPRAPSLDSADLKLIKEISEIAMLKHYQRMKALKKMRAAKSSSSSSCSSMLAIVFTVVFCILIILQGMSSGKSSVSSFQGSPVSAGGAEGGLNAVQHNLNPFSSDPNAPGLVSHK